MKVLSIFMACMIICSSTSLGAVEVNPGYPGNIELGTTEPESPLRRGEVIFFISYPFTFLGSFAVYGIAGYGMRVLESGKQDFAAEGPFFGLVAVTAAMLSFGIAMNDYYAVKAETRTVEGHQSALLSLSFRF